MIRPSTASSKPKNAGPSLSITGRGRVGTIGGNSSPPLGSSSYTPSAPSSPSLSSFSPSPSGSPVLQSTTKKRQIKPVSRSLSFSWLDGVLASSPSPTTSIQSSPAIASPLFNNASYGSRPPSPSKKREVTPVGSPSLRRPYTASPASRAFSLLKDKESPSLTQITAFMDSINELSRKKLNVDSNTITTSNDTDDISPSITKSESPSISSGSQLDGSTTLSPLDHSSFKAMREAAIVALEQALPSESTVSESTRLIKTHMQSETVSYHLLHQILKEFIRIQESMNNEIAEMKNNHSNTVTTMAADLEHMRASNSALEIKLRSTESALVDTRLRLEKSKHKKSFLREQEKDYIEKTMELSKQKLEAQKRLDWANAHLETTEPIIAAYEARLQDAQAKIDSLTSATQSHDAKVRSLSSDHESYSLSLRASLTEAILRSDENQITAQKYKEQTEILTDQLTKMKMESAARRVEARKLARKNKESLAGVSHEARESIRSSREVSSPTLPTSTSVKEFGQSFQGKVVVAFVQICDTESLWNEHPSAMNIAVSIALGLARDKLILHQGHEILQEGETMMAAFPSTSTGVNIIEAFVSWCNEVHMALNVTDMPEVILQSKHERMPDGRVLFKGLRVRIGAHCGLVKSFYNTTTNRSEVFGVTVRLAARITAAAHGGQTLVSQKLFSEIPASLRGFTAMELPEDYAVKDGREVEQMVQILPTILSMRKFSAPIAPLPVSLIGCLASDLEAGKYSRDSLALMVMVVGSEARNDKTFSENSQAVELFPIMVANGRTFARFVPPPKDIELMGILDNLESSFVRLRRVKKEVESNLKAEFGADIELLDAENKDLLHRNHALTLEKEALERKIDLEKADKEQWMKKAFDLVSRYRTPFSTSPSVTDLHALSSASPAEGSARTSLSEFLPAHRNSSSNTFVTTTNHSPV